MTLKFEGDAQNLWLGFFIYYKEVGCYFAVSHRDKANYNIKFPAYKEYGKDFKEYLLNTDISVFERDNEAIIKDVIEQVINIAQRNLLPQHSNIEENLLRLLFEDDNIIKVKE